MQCDEISKACVHEVSEKRGEWEEGKGTFRESLEGNFIKLHNDIKTQ